MKTLRPLISAALIALSAPAFAQTASAPTPADTQATDDPRSIEQLAKQEEIDAQEAPTTRLLNEEANAAAAPSIPVEGPEADRYRADLDAYARAVERTEATKAALDADYARRQAAYAGAMAAWRLQVAACEDGKRRICEQPAPDPADFR